jgi:poly-gamma-glutamate capsule biosynthesis protein CapA/YwtB (metallophosphatase superfamily)
MRGDAITLFLCGDVMTGRGVDQILRHPSAPELHEPSMRDARHYVDLAEGVNGPIPRGVDAGYVWGDALHELDRVQPAVRIINLETTITTSDTPWPGKPVHYRMHPTNVDCLTAAHVDVCTLANNHVLDYGYAGLLDTLDTLHDAGIKTAGAGRDLAEAERPAVVELSPGARVIVFSLGCKNSGVPDAWSAMPERSGVDYLPDLSDATADRVLDRVAAVRQRGDLVIASIHWGSNWGYDVPGAYGRFAHRLLDGGVALVHGHSSHHPRPIELHNGKLILYGCGDFLTDYEGISGFGEYRGDLALMYFPMLEVETGNLLELRMRPMRVRRFQARFASRDEAEWLRNTLQRESQRFGTWVAAQRFMGDYSEPE